MSNQPWLDQTFRDVLATYRKYIGNGSIIGISLEPLCMLHMEFKTVELTTSPERLGFNVRTKCLHFTFEYNVLYHLYMNGAKYVVQTDADKINGIRNTLSEKSFELPALAENVIVRGNAEVQEGRQYTKDQIIAKIVIEKLRDASARKAIDNKISLLSEITEAEAAHVFYAAGFHLHRPDAATFRLGENNNFSLLNAIREIDAPIILVNEINGNLSKFLDFVQSYKFGWFLSNPELKFLFVGELWDSKSDPLDTLSIGLYLAAAKVLFPENVFLFVTPELLKINFTETALKSCWAEPSSDFCRLDYQQIYSIKETLQKFFAAVPDVFLLGMFAHSNSPARGQKKIFISGLSLPEDMLCDCLNAADDFALDGEIPFISRDALQSIQQSNDIESVLTEKTVDETDITILNTMSFFSKHDKKLAQTFDQWVC